MTQEINKLAEVYCKGRVISVLEGGYNIFGGVVSSFAQSVHSHVRALVNPLTIMTQNIQMTQLRRKREYLRDVENFRQRKQKLNRDKFKFIELKNESVNPESLLLKENTETVDNENNITLKQKDSELVINNETSGIVNDNDNDNDFEIEVEMDDELDENA